ncbi:MAG: ribbon-helix-helix protein, CopG family [Chloroflexota bacterium]|nr:ribbon-helix-helix protein, CopG family [Chloroflexota bacterium]
MPEAIALTLPPELELSLDAITRRENRSVGALIEEAIKEYLFFRRYRLLRERMIPQVRAQGIYTDQDVFALVS